MQNLGSCNIAVIKLKFSKPIDNSLSRAQQLRGAIASAFTEEPIFHHHEDNNLLYHYPLIHYRWENSNRNSNADSNDNSKSNRNSNDSRSSKEGGYGVIVGINQGAERIIKIPWLDLPLTLAKDKVVVEESEISYKKGTFGISDRLERYNFISPWLAFNQENYKNYQTLSPSEQIQERDRILVAQLLMLLKEMNIIIKERLYAAFNVKRSIVCPYKDQNLMGFFGDFVSNLILPENLAVGRSVSHGYGSFSKDIF